MWVGFQGPGQGLFSHHISVVRVPTCLSGIQRPTTSSPISICIFIYLGFSSLRAGEGGPHSYSNRARAGIRNGKIRGSPPIPENSPAANSKPLSSSGSKGGGLGACGHGEESRKQAYSQMICT